MQNQVVLDLALEYAQDVYRRNWERLSPESKERKGRLMVVNAVCRRLEGAGCVNSGYAKLCMAVLAQAIHEAECASNEGLQNSARAFLLSDRVDYHCHGIGIESEFLRATLREMSTWLC